MPLSPSQRRLLAFTAVVFLLFFRPRLGMSAQLWRGLDDACYVEWLHRLMGLDYPYCQSTVYGPGAAVFWLPAGWLARALAWARGDALVVWLPLTIGLASFAAWAMALALAGDALFVLNAPALYYATQRTTMAHAVELFLGFAVARAAISGRRWLALLLALWLAKTRPNDAPALLLVLGAFIDGKDRGALVAGLVTVACAVPLVALGLSGAYHGTTFAILARGLIRAGIWTKLVDPSWGWLWTAPLFLVVFCAGLTRRLTWTARGALAWMGLNLALCAGWWGNGSDFGYRYLIGSFAGAWVVWRELNLSRAFLWPGAIWMTYLTWIYKTRWAASYWFDGTSRIPFQIAALRQLLHPVRLIEGLGLSAPGFVVFSWFHESFPGYANWPGWRGAPLVFLTGTVLVAGYCAAAASDTQGQCSEASARKRVSTAAKIVRAIE